MAPDLLPIVREMGARSFIGRVLHRYDWPPSAAESAESSQEDSARLDAILQRRDGALTMPAWQGEPVVTAHIADLYAYLSARADGRLGPGRPTN